MPKGTPSLILNSRNGATTRDTLDPGEAPGGESGVGDEMEGPKGRPTTSERVVEQSPSPQRRDVCRHGTDRSTGVG